VRTLRAFDAWEPPVLWIIAAAVVVVLLALAWWTSGRAKPGPDLQRGVDMRSAEGKSRSQITGTYGGPREI
jgi:hypothetical protein